MPDSASSPEGDLFGGRYARDSERFSDDASHWLSATDTTLKRPVTIRVLRDDLQESTDALAAFRSEVAEAALLHHPNIIAVHDIAENDDGDPIGLVMAPLPANTLLRHLRDRATTEIGRSGLQLARTVLDAVTPALEHAHAAGIAHGFLRPQLVATDGDWATTTSATIAGFGSRWRSGTDGYMSPEHATGDDPSAASDVYSLGAILYEALSGHRPEPGSGSTTRLHHVSKTPWPVADVVMAAISPDPKERPASARELQTMFHDAADTKRSRSVASRNLATPHASDAPLLDAPRARSHRLMGLGALLVALLAAPFILTALFGGDGEDASSAANTETVAGETANAEVPANDEVADTRVTGAAANVETVELIAASATPVPTPLPTATSTATPTPTPRPAPVIAQALPFDPPPGSGGENDIAAPLVFDGLSDTVWTTEIYGGPDFGGLKAGVGIWVELVEPTVITAVAIDSGMTGWAGDIYVADAPGLLLEEWGDPVAPLDSTVENNGEFEVELPEGTEGGAVLIWITQAAVFFDGGYGSSIDEITLR